MPDETSLVDRYLTTPVSALVAFVLAVLALMGQNALSVAVGAFAQRGVSGLTGFFLGFGLALLVQVGLAVVLARRALADDAAAGWVPTLARAAVVLAALALVAGVLALIGTAVSNAAPGGF
ncbi:MAG TPA: hypothetical protein VFY86_17730 [Nocardioides sp.]|jgi:hypothetical protein|nr:hypothetical protein [uncultured Nocardioides sp.]HEX5988370.1 hypothetical protein [Nocardioides sp.]